MSEPVPEGELSGFDRRAARYDELRPVDEGWWEVFDAIVRLGEARGARVVDIGCGTGRLADELRERAVSRVWTVDASVEMVARAKQLGVNARVARAEALPFKTGWFDVAIMRLVAHLVRRPRAFEEAARILAPGGRLVVVSDDPDHAGNVWFGRYFPSVSRIRQTIFPGQETLRSEFEAAGFATVAFERLKQSSTIDRERALDVIRSKAYSTIEALSADEYADGLARAEVEQPDTLDVEQHMLLAVAHR